MLGLAASLALFQFGLIKEGFIVLGSKVLRGLVTVSMAMLMGAGGTGWMGGPRRPRGGLRAAGGRQPEKPGAAPAGSARRHHSRPRQPRLPLRRLARRSDRERG